MKKIIAFLFLCFAFKSIAQPTKQGFNQIKFDTTIFKATTVSGDPNYIRVDSNWVKSFSSGSGSIMWGDIGGTLSDQTDLQNALDLKLNINDTTGKWQPLGNYATTSQLNLKVDSTKRTADSVFYYTNGIKHFAYLVGTSATPTWAQTLAQGNVSGGNLVMISDGDLITGSSGLWRIDFGTDNQFYVTNANDLTKPHLFIDDSFSELGSSTRFFHSDGGSNHNRHDVLIELDAPQIQFNQQVGTGTSIATLSATGLIGRSAFGSMLFADSSNFVRKTDSTNSITGYTTLYQNSLKQDLIATGTTLQYFRGDLSLATFPTNVSSFTNDAGYITSAGVTNIYNTDGTLTGNRILNADGKTLEIQDNGKHQMIFDPANKYWAIGDFDGDFGNATSIHIADSIGTVRIDGNLVVQGMNTFDPSNQMYPVYWNQGTQYLSTGYNADSIWRVAGIDSFYWREQGRTPGGTIYAIKDSVGASSSGEVNTASNLGGGLANFDSKSGVDLQFNSFNSSDFDLGSNVISIDYTNGQAASSLQNGFLSASNWSTFNNKQSALTITTVGNNLIGLTNPSAITFIRINADNSVTARSAANFRSDIGAGTGNGDALTSNSLSQFASTTSAQLRTVLSDENGTGAALFDGSTSASFVTPVLGTPTSGNLANCTFPTLNQNTSGSAGSVLNALSIGAELISGGATSYNGSAPKTLAIQSGSVTNAMLAGSIDLTTKVTGTLPAGNGGTGITSLGTGVATALGINVGSAGAFVTNGGALGTPSSGTATNLTGLPLTGLASQASLTVVANSTTSSASPTAITLATLRSILGDTIVTQSADTAITSTGLINVRGDSVFVAANTQYVITVNGRIGSSGNGGRFAMVIPSGATIELQGSGNATTNSQSGIAVTGSGTELTVNMSALNTTASMCSLNALVSNGSTAGWVKLQARVVTSGTFTVFAGLRMTRTKIY